MNRAWCETLAKLADRWACDWVLQLGDFGYWPHERNRRGKPTGETFLDGVDRQAERFGIKWGFLDGNHEDHNALEVLVRTAATTDDGFVQVRDRLAYVPAAIAGPGTASGSAPSAARTPLTMTTASPGRTGSRTQKRCSPKT